MKIVHVTSVHAWQDTRIFYRMCQGLAQAGHDVHLVAPGAPDSIVDDVAMSQLPSIRNRFLRASLIAPIAVIRAARMRADIVHLHDAELLPWGQILRWFGAKVVFDMHEYLPGAIDRKHWIPRKLRPLMSRIWAGLERILSTGIPTIFAEHSYLKHYPWIRRSKVVLNLPDARRLLAHPASRLELERVVYVGGVSEARGSLVTLEALRILQARGCNVGFLCIGPSTRQHRAELRNFVRRHDLQRIQFEEFRPQPEALRLAWEGSIGLALLQPERNYVESYPTKIFEYMAMGLPVIASNFPLYRSVVEPICCGLCVDPRFPEEIASCIEHILGDRARALEMGKEGRAAVENRYNWSCEQEKLELFYSSLVD